MPNFDRKEDVHVDVNAREKYEMSDASIYLIDIWKIHESYKREPFLHDIALIKLKKDIKFSPPGEIPTIQPIGLAKDVLRYIYGFKVLLVGLGRTEVILLK